MSLRNELSKYTSAERYLYDALCRGHFFLMQHTPEISYHMPPRETWSNCVPVKDICSDYEVWCQYNHDKKCYRRHFVHIVLKLIKPRKTVTARNEFSTRSRQATCFFFQDLHVCRKYFAQAFDVPLNDVPSLFTHSNFEAPASQNSYTEQETISYLRERIRELERKIDPDRTKKRITEMEKKYERLSEKVENAFAAVTNMKQQIATLDRRITSCKCTQKSTSRDRQTREVPQKQQDNSMAHILKQIFEE